MATYSKTHKSMDCPRCGKPLVESEPHDEVACSDSECGFNILPNFGRIIETIKSVQLNDMIKTLTPKEKKQLFDVLLKD